MKFHYSYLTPLLAFVALTPESPDGEPLAGVHVKSAAKRIDRILESRAILFQPDAEPYTKYKLISDLLCSDLGKNARKMRPEPIYIDWAQDCTFIIRGIPGSRLEDFHLASEQAAEKTFALVGSYEPINMASVFDMRFDVVLNPDVAPPPPILSQ